MKPHSVFYVACAMELVTHTLCGTTVILVSSALVAGFTPATRLTYARTIERALAAIATVLLVLVGLLLLALHRSCERFSYALSLNLLRQCIASCVQGSALCAT